MAIKTHLYDSAEPAKEGSKLLAICGAIVPDAAFVFMWDDAEVNNTPSVLPHVRGACRQCTRLLAQRMNRYIYGIRSGEEQKQSEASS